MTRLRHIVVLGSTGSVGVNTLDVIARHKERFNVLALTAHRQVDLLLEQCLAFSPRYAVVGDAASAQILSSRLGAAGNSAIVLHGARALEQVAALSDADTVMAAIVGIAGLRATFAAVEAGKRVLLANKEALVTAGPVFMQALRASGATLVPIDSEHNAIFQALPAGFDGNLLHAGVRRLLLTASGGPFWRTPLNQMSNITPQQACAHPNWVMGQKISVDSATMMNKGLEIIEACWLFQAEESQVEVVVHPQSIVHSLVEYIDGSVIAQLSNPDMRTPIAYALGYPDRIEAGVRQLDLAALGALSFAAPDTVRFPSLRLAREALRCGGSAPTILNAANEVAVAAFLESNLSFNLIPALIEDTLAAIGAVDLTCLEDVFHADDLARRSARAWLKRHKARLPYRTVSASA